MQSVAENTTNRSSRFGTGLVIYVLIFLILSAAGLIFFYDWLAAYEATRPIYAVQAYEAQLRSTGLGAETVARLRAVDHEVQSDAEIKASADAILREATLIKSSAQSTGDRQAYQVRAGGNVLGTVYFEAKGEKKFNLRAWIPTEEDYDFSAYLEPLSFSVPEDYTVFVNGHPLGGGYITEQDIRYQTLSDYYDEYRSLPTMVTYSVGILGNADVSMTDGSGSPVSPEDRTEMHFLDTADSGTRSRLSDFAREFVSDYVQFTADVGGSHYVYYSQLQQMIRPGSPLLDRMAQSLGSFGYTTTRSCKIIEDRVNICMSFSRGVYFVDYSYTTETVGSAEAVKDSRNVRLVMEEEGDRLLVTDMTYY